MIDLVVVPHLTKIATSGPSCLSHTTHPSPAIIGILELFSPTSKTKILDLNPWTLNVILNKTGFLAHIMFALQPVLHTCCCSSRQPYKLHHSAYGTYHCGSRRKWSEMPRFAASVERLTCYRYRKDLWNFAYLINEVSGKPSPLQKSTLSLLQSFFGDQGVLLSTHKAASYKYDQDWMGILILILKEQTVTTQPPVSGINDVNLTICQNENLLQSAGIIDDQYTNKNY